MSNFDFIFFGTTDFSIKILEKLKSSGFIPSLIVTRADSPKGRHLNLTSPPVKLWAQKNNIDFLQPQKLDSEFTKTLKIYPFRFSEGKVARAKTYNLFIVADYGKIIPREVLDIPQKGALNVHPSLLPKLRGASPIESAILNENETGITIMKMDEEMDHGPILAQKCVLEWQDSDPPYTQDLEKILAEEGGNLLVEVLPKYLSGEIKSVTQDEKVATFTKKIKKEDALINLNANPRENIRKIRAYHIWPKAFTNFDTKRGTARVIISRARIEGNELIIEKVIPEGKREMSFTDFKNGFLR